VSTVPRDPEDIAYLRIAGLLRADITAGRIPPGGRLPSETQLMMRHRVSRSVAKWAIAVLKADRLVDGRQGAGVFVRSPQRLIRRPERRPSIPSWIQDGEPDPWPCQLDEVRADVDLADRLTVPCGTPLRRARFQQAGPGPRQLVTSWRPATAEDLAPRWLAERVIARPARPDEIDALGLPARGCVLHIARTFSAGGLPIETADIVLALDQVELRYEFPVR
jgi:DNA-binding GntR family transcriptional regulator